MHKIQEDNRRRFHIHFGYLGIITLLDHDLSDEIGFRSLNWDLNCVDINYIAMIHSERPADWLPV